MFVVRRVVGDSMLPEYRPGTIVVGVSWLRPKVGRVVVARHGGREIIKRVARIENEGIFVLGDNPSRSTDSRSYGYLPPRTIKSVIIWSITR